MPDQNKIAVDLARHLLAADLKATPVSGMLFNMRFIAGRTGLEPEAVFKLAGEFFQKFEALVGTPGSAGDAAPATRIVHPRRKRPTWWFTAAAIIVSVLWYLLNR